MMEAPTAQQTPLALILPFEPLLGTRHFTLPALNSGLSFLRG